MASADSLRSAWHWHRPLIGLTAALVLTGLISAVGYLADDRVLVGVPIWDKPLLFSISFALYALTLAWLISRLRGPRVRRAADRLGTTIAGATAVEMAAIVLQVVRGRQSHFNFSTPFDSAVFAAMGVMVLVIFCATIAVGVAFLLESPVAERATTWAVRVGLGVSVAGMSVGFLMVVPRSGQTSGAGIRGAHSVGVADGGPALPLLGWSTTGGDLRIPHFVGLHALQVLPLLALALTLSPATARLAERTRVRLVLVAAAGYVGLFALTLSQALRGQPLIRPDVWTIAAAVVLVVAVGAAAIAVLRADRTDVEHPRESPPGPARCSGNRFFLLEVGVAEAAADEEHPESVVVVVAEPACDASVELDEAVDGLRAAAVGPGGVEVGQERG